MLSKKFISKTELLRWIEKEVTEYCSSNHLPILSVKYGSVPAGSKATFAYPPPRIQIWVRYSEWLSQFGPQNRVWNAQRALFHELWHYRQFLDAVRRGKRITIDVFSEDDAYVHGNIQADRIVSNLSQNEINPILETIGSAAIMGIGLGAGFKFTDVVWNKFSKRKKNPREPYPILAPSTKKFSGKMYGLDNVYQYRQDATRAQLLLKRMGYRTRIFMVSGGWAIYYRR